MKTQSPKSVLGSYLACLICASPRSQAGSTAGSSLRPAHLAQTLHDCFDERSKSVVSLVNILDCSLPRGHRTLASMNRRDLVETQMASVISLLASHEGAGRGKSCGMQMAMVEVRVVERCKLAAEECCCTDTCLQQQGCFREPNSLVELVLWTMRVHEE